MIKTLGGVTAVGVGTGAAIYFLDPTNGTHRRAVAKNKITEATLRLRGVDADTASDAADAMTLADTIGRIRDIGVHMGTQLD